MSAKPILDANYAVAAYSAEQPPTQQTNEQVQALTEKIARLEIEAKMWKQCALDNCKPIQLLFKHNPDGKPPTYLPHIIGSLLAEPANPAEVQHLATLQNELQSGLNADNIIENAIRVGNVSYLEYFIKNG